MNPTLPAKAPERLPGPRLEGALERALLGPLLTKVAYPEVLVPRAVSDGRALERVLRPGDGACRTTVALERFVPGRAHRVRGGVVDRMAAHGTGRALLEVALGGRTEVQVWPAD